MQDSHNNEQPITRCEDIQELLFDYMSRELGESRSALIREHLRKCPECQNVAAEIQTTLALLEGDSRETTNASARLSDERRKRLKWAVMHPILDWVYRQHMLVSLVVAIVVLAGTLVILATLKREPFLPVDRGPTVNIDGGPPRTNAPAVQTD